MSLALLDFVLFPCIMFQNVTTVVRTMIIQKNNLELNCFSYICWIKTTKGAFIAETLQDSKSNSERKITVLQVKFLIQLLTTNIKQIITFNPRVNL